MYFDRTLEAIERGRNGGNVGLPYGLPSLVPYVPNIQKETYYLVGGETGSGKTALTDYMFLYSPFDFIMNNETDFKLKILYWSFEISIEAKIAKGICQKIWKDYKVLVDTNYIFSRGENRISQETYDLVLKTRKYFDRLYDMVEIIDLSTNPTGISKKTEDLCKSYHHRIVTGTFTDDTGKERETVTWKEKDPNQYILTIVDHAGLIRAQKDLITKKDRIDYISNRFIEYRTKYKLSPIIVSQFNRGLDSAQRELSTKAKPDYSKVRPQLGDFKDSGGTQEDANVVFSIFSPNRYNIPEYNEYNVEKLKDRFRVVDVLKSRDSLPDLAKGVGYLGECGLFIDLPLPGDMPATLYNQITNVKKRI